MEAAGTHKKTRQAPEESFSIKTSEVETLLSERLKQGSIPTDRATGLRESLPLRRSIGV